jgi:hypothetical protein
LNGLWRRRLLGALLLLVCPVLGCATAREFAALRQVQFRFDRISSPRLAGIPLDQVRSYEDLRAADLTRLAQAVATRDVPIELTVHVEGKNPEENDVTARLVALDWSYLVDDRETVSGRVSEPYTFPPGQPRDIPLLVAFDLANTFQGGARDLLEVALVLAGHGSGTRKVTLRLVPTVDTPIGPIRYPAPIDLDLSNPAGR